MRGHGHRRPGNVFLRPRRSPEHLIADRYAAVGATGLPATSRAVADRRRVDFRVVRRQTKWGCTILGLYDVCHCVGGCRENGCPEARRRLSGSVPSSAAGRDTLAALLVGGRPWRVGWRWNPMAAAAKQWHTLSSQKPATSFRQQCRTVLFHKPRPEQNSTHPHPRVPSGCLSRFSGEGSCVPASKESRA